MHESVISFSFGMQKSKLHQFLQRKKQSFLQWLLLLYYQCFLEILN